MMMPHGVWEPYVTHLDMFLSMCNNFYLAFQLQPVCLFQKGHTSLWWLIIEYLVLHKYIIQKNFPIEKVIEMNRLLTTNVL